MFHFIIYTLQWSRQIGQKSIARVHVPLYYLYFVVEQTDRTEVYCQSTCSTLLSILCSGVDRQDRSLLLEYMFHFIIYTLQWSRQIGQKSIARVHVPLYYLYFVVEQTDRTEVYCQSTCSTLLSILCSGVDRQDRSLLLEYMFHFIIYTLQWSRQIGQKSIARVHVPLYYLYFVVEQTDRTEVYCQSTCSTLLSILCSGVDRQDRSLLLEYMFHFIIYTLQWSRQIGQKSIARVHVPLYYLYFVVEQTDRTEVYCQSTCSTLLSILCSGVDRQDRSLLLEYMFHFIIYTLQWSRQIGQKSIARVHVPLYYLYFVVEQTDRTEVYCQSTCSTLLSILCSGVDRQDRSLLLEYMFHFIIYTLQWSRQIGQKSIARVHVPLYYLYFVVEQTDRTEVYCQSTCSTLLSILCSGVDRQDRSLLLEYMFHFIIYTLQWSRQIGQKSIARVHVPLYYLYFVVEQTDRTEVYCQSTCSTLLSILCSGVDRQDRSLLLEYMFHFIIYTLQWSRQIGQKSIARVHVPLYYLYFVVEQTDRTEVYCQSTCSTLLSILCSGVDRQDRSLLLEYMFHFIIYTLQWSRQIGQKSIARVHVPLYYLYFVVEQTDRTEVYCQSTCSTLLFILCSEVDSGQKSIARVHAPLYYLYFVVEQTDRTEVYCQSTCSTLLSILCSGVDRQDRSLLLEYMLNFIIYTLQWSRQIGHKSISRVHAPLYYLYFVVEQTDRTEVYCQSTCSTLIFMQR